MQIELLKQILKQYDFIDFALLFGSYANGTHTTLSDMDIAIHTTRPIDLLEQGYMIASLEDKLEKRIDLILLNDLYKENAKMAFNVVDNHQVILCNELQKYIDFKTYTYKYYFDQKPMYEMFDKALVERIERGTYGKTQAS